uniref:Reverse transcriptase domain-containing protein n=1 Tax=Ananas comosus var. bracteatus TaxID=296719 RepID=A0A6V7QIA5_ANACO|nr:unnamed protein product [Ananas comosus var. bracteatus]
MSHPEGDARDVVVGITSLFGSHARTLFDTGTSHSFISCSFARDHVFESSPLPVPLRVQTPEKDLGADRCIRSCPILLGDQAFLANLALLSLKEFDLVLGMDWFTKHHATINCEQRTVIFAEPGEEKSSTVHWANHKEREATWELETAMREQYPQLFAEGVDGDGRDLREEDEENDDNGENAGEEEDTYLSDGVEEEDDDSDFGENILNGLEDSAVVEDCSWSVSTVITKEYVLVTQRSQSPMIRHPGTIFFFCSMCSPVTFSAGLSACSFDPLRQQRFKYG